MLESIVLATALVAPALESDLDLYMTRLESIGFSGGILVTKNDQVVLEKGYGFADRAKGRRTTTETVFDLGSVTKQFTAAAILKLESQGKLSTDDTVGRFFEGVPPDKQGMTLHHLLTHSSGLRSDFADSDYDPVERDEYVRRALASKLLWPPGTRYEYSNAGYSLLAVIVEIVSGEPYETYLRERIFKPLGMFETGYKLPAWPLERIAHGYREGEDWGTIVERLSPEGAPFWVLRGNGGIHTTMKDVRTWHKALETDALLPAASRRKLFTPYIDEDDSGRTQYAYGWVVEKTARGTRDIWHNGGNGVYMAELHRFVDEGILVFVASTVSELPASPVFETVRRIVFGESYELPPAAVAVSAAKLEEMRGGYRLPSGGEIELLVTDGGLAASLKGQDAYDAWAPAALDPKRQHSLTERTREIVVKAFASDYGPLHAATENAIPLEEVRNREIELMQNRESRLGAFKGFEVLGTSSRPNGLSVTDVRVDFERGSAFNRYVWREDRIVDLQGMPRLRSIRLVPVSEGEWVAYDLASGTGPRLRRVGADTLEIGAKTQAVRMK